MCKTVTSTWAEVFFVIQKTAEARSVLQKDRRFAWHMLLGACLGFFVIFGGHDLDFLSNNVRVLMRSPGSSVMMLERQKLLGRGFCKFCGLHPRYLAGLKEGQRIGLAR